MNSMPEQPQNPDDILPGVTALARAALEEFTSAETIGEVTGYELLEDGVLNVHFAPKLLGYPGWSWVVSAARVGDEDPTILEADLIPGEGALLAPEWVPWAQRLSEFRAAQKAAEAEAALAAAAASDDDDEFDGELEEDDFDPQDDDEDADDPDASRLHSGDLDGVDIDELDPDAFEASDEDDESGEEE